MIDQTLPSVRVRFAPSPTGYLHIGGARQAIFNWLFAKANNGKFLLRIEDTDTARSSDEYKVSIINALCWLGLTIDEDIVIQSQNQPYHSDVAAMLIEKGVAYRCYCSSELLQEMRDSSSDVAFRYPGTCWLNRHKNINLAKNSSVIRFRLPEDISETLEFNDKVKGLISIKSSSLDDFVIIKSDGVATYNFAVVLDDIKMKVTHVLRGEDHVINTFKQIILYQVLEQAIPVFAHAPMILGANGERLSKRHGATAVIDYKLMGILPDAMFNYLVRLGWSHGDDEIFSREELCKIFTLEAIGKKNGIFDYNKLLWLNSVYIKKLSFEAFCNHLSEINTEQASMSKNLLLSADRDVVAALFALFQPRVNTILELASLLLGCLVVDQSVLRERLSLLTVDQKTLLKMFLDQVASQANISATNMQLLAKEYVLRAQKKLPDLAKPLRFALSGQMEGASAFALSEILGLERLRFILSAISS